ncbi:MAG: hypothetical protein Roseis2KO_00200 [Roseivirga sp.]
MRESIQQVLDFIEDHLSEPLSSEKLAEKACLSPSRFHRVFKKETGATPQKFIEKLRLTKAYEVITQGEGSIQDLAITLGYNDYETFSRAFKRLHHYSPDDLKTIAQKVKAGIDGQSRVFMVTHDTLEMDAIREKVMQRLKEENIDLKDIAMHHAIMIKPVVLSKDGEDGELVRNKYLLNSGERIWKQLITDIHPENEEEKNP